MPVLEPRLPTASRQGYRRSTRPWRRTRWTRLPTGSSSDSEGADETVAKHRAVARGCCSALPQAWTIFALLLVAALSLWGWWLVPARWPRWVAVAAFLPALWGYVELMQSGTLPVEREQIMRWHRTVFAVAGLILALKLAPALAIASGQLDAAWEPLTLRIRRWARCLHRRRQAMPLFDSGVHDCQQGCACRVHA